MRIQIASDLHIESWRGAMPDEQAFRPAEGRDLLVLAGDIHVGLGALAFIERELARSPVVYVAGNHEHYGSMTHEELEEAWSWIARESPGLHFLSGQAATIDGVRFYGCTWYSGLWGDDEPKAAAAIERSITDFRAPYDDAGAWTVRRHVETHRRQTKAMRKYAGDVDVIVTHWPPTLHALHSMYAGAIGTERLLNRYFINDEEALVREMDARVWISGHTHMPHEARVGEDSERRQPDRIPQRRARDRIPAGSDRRGQGLAPSSRRWLRETRRSARSCERRPRRGNCPGMSGPRRQDATRNRTRRTRRWPECRMDAGVIDEIPGAYEPIDDVMERQSDLAEPVHGLRQVLNIKG